MAKAVVISHPSVVIRKGLLSVLENEIPVKMVAVEHIEELDGQFLNNFSECTFLIPSDQQNQIFEKLKQITSQYFIVALVDNETKSLDKKLDYTFYLNHQPGELINRIKAFFEIELPNQNDEELTQREKEVLRLIALGHTNKSIADALFISAHTVISHRKNITEKLGIKSIPGLTVYAIIQKIISQSDITNDQIG